MPNYGPTIILTEGKDRTYVFDQVGTTDLEALYPDGVELRCPGLSIVRAATWATSENPSIAFVQADYASAVRGPHTYELVGASGSTETTIVRGLLVIREALS